VFTTQAKDLLKTGQPAPAAFTSGYQHAFWVLVGLALAGALAALILLHRTQVDPQAEPAQAAA
jgi:hypothetical protein